MSELNWTIVPLRADPLPTRGMSTLGVPGWARG